MNNLAAYFLVGPTASGKTAVAQFIAEQKGYCILSADSMLVYKDMNIGTAKPEPHQTDIVPYSGIDIVAPDQSFNTWDYRLHALESLTSNTAQGKTTIVAGGTGLYVKSLTNGLSNLPDPDPEIRKYWDEIHREKGVEYLAKTLQQKCPALYDAIEDKKNARRLIRALELYSAGITTPPDNWLSYTKSSPVIGLNMPKEQLRIRIEKRINEMYDNGLLDEMRSLYSKYKNLSATACKAIGYAEAADVIVGKLSVDEAKKITFSRTVKLAKRQMTWFKKQSDTKWIDINIDDNIEIIANQVMELWNKYGKTEIRQ